MALWVATPNRYSRQLRYINFIYWIWHISAAFCMSEKREERTESCGNRVYMIHRATENISTILWKVVGYTLHTSSCLGSPLLVALKQLELFRVK